MKKEILDFYLWFVILKRLQQEYPSSLGSLNFFRKMMDNILVLRTFLVGIKKTRECCL